MDPGPDNGGDIMEELKQRSTLQKWRAKAFKHRINIAAYFALAVFVVFVYHFFSDGDFSFLMTLGGMFRLSAFMLLIWKVVSQKSAAGVSLKTLECYTLVFFFRLTSILIYDGYLPYDRSGDWFYQLVEILALVLTCIAAYFVFFVHAVTYERSVDQFGAKFIPSDFGIAYIAGPALLLAIIVHPGLNNNWFTDVAWTFALYLEAAAIVPQLYMFHKKGGVVESYISHFVFCLGVARLLHLVFWLSTHAELVNRRSLLSPGGAWEGYAVLVSQLVHLVLIADFMYLYASSMVKGGPMVLPTTRV